MHHSQITESDPAVQEASGRPPFRGYVVILWVLLLVAGCSSVESSRIGDFSNLQWTEADTAPKTVVILPFDNETSEPDLDILVRDSFYGHFSGKNYRDFELREVDRVLTSLAETSSCGWKDLSPTTLGALFHADYLIYGRVTEFRKTFLGLYSQIALKLELRMVSCSSGDLVFSKRMVGRSHEGGLPFSLFDIAPAALRSGWHLKKEKTMALIDRLNRELAALIPEPPAPTDSPLVLFEIQVASFLERETALTASHSLEGRGFRSRVETVSLDGRLWHRVLLGPYKNLSDAERARDRVRAESPFQPIVIHHPAPGRKEVGLDHQGVSP